MHLLSTFIEDNGVALIGICVTILGGLIAWLTTLKGDLTELKADVKHMRSIIDDLGNASRVRGDSINTRVERVEQQLTGLTVTFAEWKGQHPGAAH